MFFARGPATLMNQSVYRRLAMAGTDANNLVYTTPNIRVLEAFENLRSEVPPLRRLKSAPDMMP